VKEEDWNHDIYQHDFSSDPFAKPADLVEVYHDASLFGKGTSMIPLSMKPQTDGSISGHGTISEPLSLAMQHDDIISGLGSVKSPSSISLHISDRLSGTGTEANELTVVSAPLADEVQSAIMLLDNDKGIYFDKDQLVINGKLADGTDFDFEWPLDKDPFDRTICIDSSLSGAGSSTSPLSVVSAPKASELENGNFKLSHTAPNLTITNGTLTYQTDFNINPFFTGLKTDATLQGTGIDDWPLTVIKAPNADLATRATTADKIQGGANILQLTNTQTEILGMQGTQTFAYAAPLTTNPFFLGISTESTHTGDGSDDSPLHVVSSGSSGLTPVIGVDELIFDKSIDFDDIPMEDGKRIFHINYQVDVQAAAYINANIGVEFPVARFHLPDKYINAQGVPIGYCDSKFVKYSEGDCATSSQGFSPMVTSGLWIM
jgi:hypothetical protein